MRGSEKERQPFSMSYSGTLRTEVVAMTGAEQGLDQAKMKRLHRITRAFPYFLICSPGKSPTAEPSQLETLQAVSKIWHPHWKAGTAGPHQ